ncbi:MOSC domain-containing protein [Streptomyces pinistramenti]|uniref:MOSC domain-containing protein n=1 Tax=Streptomyces pinistramenti TaxID=2884812 RepID=UPI001D0803F0|nr:MOSC N-terminal beta barrel domain-containing protein [Streptomyces pinistramenti]MCB5911315.1 MOSC N-terminal beta barrel domain-containing protein [Streptomyces pinistramenti]
MARVVDLITYPVKGCAGIPSASADLTPAGLAHDRSFLVVRGDGVFRSQRTDPVLATVRPEVSPDGRQLTLRAPDIEPLHIDVDRTGPRTGVEMFGTPYRAIDQGSTAADWLSDVLGSRSRLVRVPPDHDRVTDGLHPGTSHFADSSAVHLISRATLDALNTRITAVGGTPVPMDRFRPNIVVDGWDEPHTEDHAHRIAIGDTELGFTKHAVRCAVTLIDQQTGTKKGPDPLRTLATYRRIPKGGVTLGSKYSVLRPGHLTLGTTCTATTLTTPVA